MSSLRRTGIGMRLSLFALGTAAATRCWAGPSDFGSAPFLRQTPTETNPPLVVTNAVIHWDSITLAVAGWGTVLMEGTIFAGFTTDWNQVVSTPMVLGGLRGTAETEKGATDSLSSGSALPPGAVEDLTTAHTVGVACGEFHTLLLKRDGSVVARGWNVAQQAQVPVDLTNAVAVACGADHSLAVRRDGTVVAWGHNRFGQCEVPVGLDRVIGIAGGTQHSLALRADGSVVAWGANLAKQSRVPDVLPPCTAVAAGAFHSLALTRAGRVAAWGSDSDGQSTVPDGLRDVVAITAGGNFSLALKSDGTVVGWGAGDAGQLDIPPGLSNVVAIAAGNYHGLALRDDGTVVGWGGNLFSSPIVPAGLERVVAIAAGGFHNEALVQTVPPLTNTRVESGRLRVDLNLPAGWTYQLEASRNFVDWLPVRTAVVTPGEMTLSTDIDHKVGGGFFRVRPISGRIVRFLR